MYVEELAKAVIYGALSIPVDLAYGARRTYEDIAGSSIVKKQNEAERQRVWRVLKKAFDFGTVEIGPISKIVKVVLTDFYTLLPDEALEAIAKKAGLGTSFMAGRMSTQLGLTTLIVRKLTKKIVVRVAVRRAVKFGIGFAASGLLLQGLIERASESSKKLQLSHPQIYSTLRKNDLDMAFVLVEGHMQPILKAIKAYERDRAEFDRIIKEIINEN